LRGVLHQRKKERKKASRGQGKVHCGSALGPGASGLLYYCTPLVWVPAVIQGLAAWQHNKPKTKKTKGNPPGGEGFLGKGGFL